MAASKAEAEAEKITLPPVLAPMRDAPIFLISTHGYYDISEPDQEPIAFTLPPNTFVFETATIGDLTCTTIDPHLWTIVMGENRQNFLRYLMGKINRNDRVNENGDIDETFFYNYIKVFKNMHFYKPGDTIYVRNLELSGGRDANLTSTERDTYSTFGFYHFPITSKVDAFPERGAQRPSAQIKRLEPLRRRMIAPNMKSNTEVLDVMITNEDVLTKSFRRDFSEIGSPSIFIFSSCGEVRCGRMSEFECNRRFKLIEQHQQNQDEVATRIGMRTPISDENEYVMPVLRRSKLSRRPMYLDGRYVPGFAFAANEEELNALNKARARGAQMKTKGVGENRENANEENEFNDRRFTFFDPSEEEHPLRRVPQEPLLDQPPLTTIIYKVTLLEPKPFPEILIQEHIKSMVMLKNIDDSPFFSDSDVNKLLIQKKRRPDEYENSELYFLSGKQLRKLKPIKPRTTKKGGFVRTRKHKCRKNKMLTRKGGFAPF
jgi:hypothetical protein